MSKVTPQQAAEKWSRNLGASTEDIRRGVERVSVAPGQLAADAQDRLVAAFTEAVRTGKWATRVAGVSLQEWKQALLTKGLPRIAGGAQAATPKMQRFMADFLPFVDSVQAEVKSMPNMTLEDRIQRSVANMRRLSEYKRPG